MEYKLLPPQAVKVSYRMHQSRAAAAHSYDRVVIDSDCARALGCYARTLTIKVPDNAEVRDNKRQD